MWAGPAARGKSREAQCTGCLEILVTCPVFSAQFLSNLTPSCINLQTCSDFSRFFCEGLCSEHCRSGRPCRACGRHSADIVVPTPHRPALNEESDPLPSSCRLPWAVGCGCHPCSTRPQHQEQTHRPTLTLSGAPLSPWSSSRFLCEEATRKLPYFLRLCPAFLSHDGAVCDTGV